MTFREYLNRRKARYDLRGDFVRMAKAHDDLPEPTSWRELRVFMEVKKTPPHVLEAGQHVWADFHDILSRDGAQN